MSEQPATIEQHLKRGLSGAKLIALIAGVAVLSLLAGVALMQFVVSPAEQASRSEPPVAGPITAPIEERIIENTVIARGEVIYDNPVEAEIDTAGILERPIVTGHVPEVGDVLQAGDIALELAGRPVIVLEGELPAYRHLQVGMRGPDVVQLKQALAALDLWAGDPASDLFEVDTAWALSTLYDNRGYTVYSGGTEAQDALRSAERMVRDAQVAVAQAEAEWRRAKDADEADLSPYQMQIDGAYEMLWDAQTLAEEARINALPSLPSGEVMYLTSLPRRVDGLWVKRGDTLQGSALTVSGATLTIRGTVGAQDAELLTEGMTALYEMGGAEREAEILRLETQGSSSGSDADTDSQTTGRTTFVLSPGELTSDEITQLQGMNVRVRIPVQSTDGAVLAVPIAALSAGSDGGSRVELFLGDAEDPHRTELINVNTGLSADGYVEITSEDPRITAGTRIVVGR